MEEKQILATKPIEKKYHLVYGEYPGYPSFSTYATTTEAARAALEITKHTGGICLICDADEAREIMKLHHQARLPHIPDLP